MICSLLIANRGEIACRIIRTARRLNIRTIAVYSEADISAMHVAEADAAICIGPPPARDSYLDGTKIVAAAKQGGAEAIHPGYGFLSENADFAQAVLDAGLIWIGPKPGSIRAMGLKDAAKKLMLEAGIPIVPGYLGDDQNAAALQRQAGVTGYPVLIKAVAGGGGKGMRRVDADADFTAALAACRREAAASFGDDRVLIEKLIASPRHIEVQIFGDSHGNIVHLFERDCSLQRRLQKVIEEAPAPGMTEEMREAICTAAVRAARAVGYISAGTVEFIADASDGLRPDRFWFMEMNTRLQVEHPVTEEITGQDLVEWQLRVASGEVLPKSQGELQINGWAMEARLYAEDPGHGFQPSTGRLERFHLPDSIRVDTGVRQGDEVSPYYDPLIAKLIARDATRQEAAARLAAAARRIATWPLKTNAAFLAKAVSHPDFLAGNIDNGFIDRHIDALIPSNMPSTAVLQAAARAIVAQGELGNLAPLAGFRLNGKSNVLVRVGYDGQTYDVELQSDLNETIRAEAAAGAVFLDADGMSFRFSVPRIEPDVASGSSDGVLLAPMPGRVTAIMVSGGQIVHKGQALAILEAMKMEHTLFAPFDGEVGEINAKPGDQVIENMRLLKIDKKTL